MAIHVIYTSPVPVSNGTVINKNTATIAEMLNTDTEIRIIPDDNIPNSANYPTIEEYLHLESNDGFSLASLTNTMIVTEQ